MSKWFYRNYDIICSLIDEKASVLDLGCGDGQLLQDLKKDKNIRPLGIEINEEYVVRACEKGIPVIQSDIDFGLKEFKNYSWDYVILNRTLHVLKKPDYVLQEMLRVGKKVIISFPNFGFWKLRFCFLLKGKMPVSKEFSYPWYSTPNIHLCTIKDFVEFIKNKDCKILDAFYLCGRDANFIISSFPNLLATEAVFLLTGKKDVYS